MSLFLDLKRITRDGLISFWRNRLISFSSILIITLSLITLSSLLFFNGIVDFSLKELEKRVDVNVYFYPNTPIEDIFSFKEKINLIPEVEKITYVSQEEALFGFEKRHSQDDLIKRSLEELGGNPLGASLNIKAISSNQYEAIVNALEADPLVKNSHFVERINYFDNQKIIMRLNQFSSVVRGVSYIFILFLSLISFFVIMSTMKITFFSSKESITIKRLVGAEHRYIRGPFTVIGSLYGFIAGVLSFLVLFPITKWISGVSKTFFGGMDISIYFINNILYFAIIIIGTGVLIGFFASFIALRKYLHI